MAQDDDVTADVVVRFWSASGRHFWRLDGASELVARDIVDLVAHRVRATHKWLEMGSWGRRNDKKSLTGST